MLQVSDQDIITLRQDSSGRRFTAFVDALIRAELFIHCGINTNQRTNIADGGVDTSVERSVPGDSIAWLGHKTVWQYKAKPYADISVKEIENEIEKPFAKACIVEGYAYRFCICDGFPPDKKREYLDAARVKIRQLNPNAPDPAILNAGDLAAWAGKFPAIVMEYFRPNLLGKGIPLKSWQKSMRQLTSQYLPVKAWESIIKPLQVHVNLSIGIPDVVFSIQGEAGVGKSRMVCESLSELHLESLVLYLNNDNQAGEISNLLATDMSLCAVLVVDECSIETRLKLEEVLSGHADRIRVITIDNAGKRLPSGMPERHLTKMDTNVINAVLDANFPEVPPEHRRAYSDLTKGFVRFAAELCRYDTQISEQGSLRIGLKCIYERYLLANRLTEKQKIILRSISLLRKVGFDNDKAKELEALFSWLHLAMSKEEFIAAASAMHDAPGFIGVGGRYFYITPTVIAQLAFEDAWQTWAKPDIKRFLSEIPAVLLDGFWQRVAELDNKEVRGLVAEFFRTWALSLDINSLKNLQTTLRLVTLVEMSPADFLPILRRIIEAAPNEDLAQITGASNGLGNWGTRRYLVWLLEKLIRFHETFCDAEHILFRFALSESEPGIANNATAIWNQCFRILGSGTPVPFTTRFKILKLHVNDTNENISGLSMKCLTTLFDRHQWRTIGPSVVGGRIPPDEWYPVTKQEYRDSEGALVKFLLSLLDSRREDLRSSAYTSLILHLRHLLGEGYLSDIKAHLVFEILSDQQKLQLRSEIQDFLEYECDPERGSEKISDEIIKDVRQWLKSLAPKDFHDKIVMAVGRAPWEYNIHGDKQLWQNEIKAIAQQLYDTPVLLEENQSWLHSPEAKSVYAIGYELGKLDIHAQLLKKLLDATIQYSNTGLCKGYIAGLLMSFAPLSTSVNQSLDEIQDSYPELAYELFMSAPDRTNAFSRSLVLFDSGKLKGAAFSGFLYGDLRKQLTIENFKEVLERLLSATSIGDEVAFKVLVNFIAYEFEDSDSVVRRSVLLSHPVILDCIWKTLEIAISHKNVESYHWAAIMRVVIPIDPHRAARLCVCGLSTANLHFEDDAMRLLISIAETHPAIVMQEFGEALLDKTNGWHYKIGIYRPLVVSLPATVVIDWLKQTGVEGARGIARHLPQPVLKDNMPEIHPLTEYVLNTYALDDETFNAFCAGVDTEGGIWGDISAHYYAKAQFAEKFANHPLRRIREWADISKRSSESWANQWKRRDEEDAIG